MRSAAADLPDGNGIAPDLVPRGRFIEATAIEATNITASYIEATYIEATYIEATYIEATTLIRHDFGHPRLWQLSCSQLSYAAQVWKYNCWLAISKPDKNNIKQTYAGCAMSV